MRKRKNGFTLIELIAIVVIIAIIVLITTPQIIKIIENGKKNTFLDSVNGIVRVVKLDNSNNDFESGEYEIKNGVVINRLGNTIKSEGGSDEEGTLSIDQEGNLEYAIHNSKWCAIFSGGVRNVLKYEEESCKIPEPILFRNFMNRGNVTTDKTKITSIEFVSHKNVPEDVVDSWDVSEEENGSVMAWLYDDTENEGYYKLYIGGNNKVYAPEDSSYLFSDINLTKPFVNLENIDLKYLNTSKVTDMRYMFYGDEKLESLDVSNFDTSKVTNMKHMFENLSQITEIDVSMFNTSKVTEMAGMFRGMSNISSLNVNNFNTSSVIRMDSMFAEMGNLTSLNLSYFDTSSVTDMHEMFYKANNLTSLNLSNFDTSKVTTMYRMFCFCTKISDLDISNFNTSKVINMRYMFYGMELLTDLDLSHFDTSSVTQMGSMFQAMFGLKTLNLSSFDTSKVTNMNAMFESCWALEKLNFRNATFASITDSKYMFSFVNNKIEIITKDDTTRDWLQDKLGEGIGFIVTVDELT